MNSAPQVETAEISDAELDNVSGGLSPHAGLTAGPTTVGDADVLAALGTVQNQVLATAAQYDQVSVSVSL
ncbi:hypothetical protein [Streptomyces cyanogenus]|uniref:Type A2 lantipeptide n=1 Tax=Streptomyces cyanogenus TaxID=80860 RepID=A0ABX7TSY8_STRCY|nr:hypothetical protein [Streptomyces cyanogenus]QTD99815.1 hypothetical protein S1361_20935 [Streptomyces cyanogenus]